MGSTEPSETAEAGPGRERTAPERPRITIVVARARNGIIGRHNALPWHLPEDLKHFKATTMGRAIVMGRRTFESIGRALPGRRTIVVTSDAKWAQPGCERAGSLVEAIALAARPGPDPAIRGDEVFVVGGARLYSQARSIADRAIVTEIEIEPEGDAGFEPLDPCEWKRASSEARKSVNGLAYRIEEWFRVGRPTRNRCAP